MGRSFVHLLEVGRPLPLVHPGCSFCGYEIAYVLIGESRWSPENYPKGALLLYHRLGWLSGGYGVGVPVHHLPLSLFLRSVDHRDPKG